MDSQEAQKAASRVYERLLAQGRAEPAARRDAERWVKGNYGIDIVLPPPTLTTWTCSLCQKKHRKVFWLERQARQEAFCLQCIRQTWAEQARSSAPAVHREPAERPSRAPTPEQAHAKARRDFRDTQGEDSEGSVLFLLVFAAFLVGSLVAIYLWSEPETARELWANLEEAASNLLQELKIGHFQGWQGV